MADPNEFEHVMPDLEKSKPAHPEKIEENMGARLIYSIIIAVMVNLAQSVLLLLTIIQFLLALINGSQPNERMAEFATDLGTWLAKAARYQGMATEEKPWPWTPWEG